MADKDNIKNGVVNCSSHLNFNHLHDFSTTNRQPKKQKKLKVILKLPQHFTPPSSASSLYDHHHHHHQHRRRRHRLHPHHDQQLDQQTLQQKDEPKRKERQDEGLEKRANHDAATAVAAAAAKVPATAAEASKVPAMADSPGSDTPALASDEQLLPPSRSSVALPSGKRKFRVLSQGLVRDTKGEGEGEGGGKGSRGSLDGRESAAASEPAVLEGRGRFCGVLVKRPVEKKIEDIGQGPECDQDTRGSLFPESDRTPLPPIKLLEALLDSLQKKDTYQVFAEPVDPLLIPDYYDIIKDPMDFSTIRKKLYEGRYDTLELFKKDVFQISINAMRYNSSKTIYYKQARAIMDAARKALTSLASLNSYIESERKVSRVAGNKKSWKKFSRSEMVRLDYSSGVTLATGNHHAYASHRAALHDDSSLAADGGYSSAFEYAYEKDALEGSGKPIGWKDGRRPLSTEEYRRTSYKPKKSQRHEQDSSLRGISGEPCQLVALGCQQEFAYGLSLAYFGASMAPPTWKYVVRKLQKVLKPDVPFGRGWVGQPEGGAFALQKNTKEPANLDNVASNFQPKDRLEAVHCKRLTQEESNATSVYQSISQTVQPASLSGGSCDLNHVPSLLVSSPIAATSSSVAPTNNRLEPGQPSNSLELVHPKQHQQGEPKVAFMYHTAAQASQPVSLTDVSHSAMCNNPPTTKPPLVTVTSKHSDAQMSSDFRKPRPMMDIATKSFQHISQGCSDSSTSKIAEILLHPSSKYHSDSTPMREVLAAQTGTVGNGLISDSECAENLVMSGGINSEKEALVPSRAVAPWDCHASMSTQPSIVEKKINSFSHSLIFPHQGRADVNVSASASSIVTVSTGGVKQSQSQPLGDGLEVKPNTHAMGLPRPIIQDLNCLTGPLPTQLNNRLRFGANTSQTSSHYPSTVSSSPVTQRKGTENFQYQEWKAVKLANFHPQLQINVSSPQLSSETVQPFSSQTVLQHSSTARNSPPDLNVCLPSPTTPSSRISADPQQPDLALQL